jgi:hypothetical protein
MTFIPQTLFKSKRVYPKDEQDYFKQMDQQWLYRRWEKRVDKQIPNLATRVFALREKMYPGWGFHYEMEKRLGKIIYELNNYDDCPQDWKKIAMRRLVMEVIVSGLFEDVKIAEMSTKGREIK